MYHFLPFILGVIPGGMRLYIPNYIPFFSSSFSIGCLKNTFIFSDYSVLFEIVFRLLHTMSWDGKI